MPGTDAQVCLDCAQSGLLEAAMPGGDLNIARGSNRECGEIQQPVGVGEDIGAVSVRFFYQVDCTAGQMGECLPG